MIQAIENLIVIDHLKISEYNDGEFWMKKSMWFWTHVVLVAKRHVVDVTTLELKEKNA